MQKKLLIAFGILLSTVLLFSVAAKVMSLSMPNSTTKVKSNITTKTVPTAKVFSTLKTYTCKVLKTFTHDTGAFTEGLAFEDDGSLIESTGLALKSSVRHVELASGGILDNYKLDNPYFGEGVTVANGAIYQLTWQSHVGFVYDIKNLDMINQFYYSTEGWGLTFDGQNLIMSDGTSKLYFLDPGNFHVVKQLNVQIGNYSVPLLNELEYVNGSIYANVWHEDGITIINPQTGQVDAWIDLTGLYSSGNPENCLNGIAYNPDDGMLLVTGKEWPQIYQIELVAPE
jgi:glutaminyl-peptide cyclotransferase